MSIPPPSASSPPASLLAKVWRDLSQPVRDFRHVPKAIVWAVALPSLFEGLAYFGLLTVMAKFLSENVALGDIGAGHMLALFSGGITFSMFLLGGTADRWGARRALLVGTLAMIVGRGLIALGETLHLAPGSLGPLHLLSLLGMLFVIIGYGTFQPTLYAAGRQYTDERTAALGFALIYALTNLGAFLSGFLSPLVRRLSQETLPPNGISGVIWLYALLTGVSTLSVWFGLSARSPSHPPKRETANPDAAVAHGLVQAPSDLAKLQDSFWVRARHFLVRHPLWNAKFSFFIFALVPVQTLFAHAWLTLPSYIERAYRTTPWVSENFEFFVNINPMLIFLLSPVAAVLTARIPIYRMMIIGTAVMASSALPLAIAPTPALLVLSLALCAFGEALWQPRFLQYIAEIAPPGQTGLYMGVGQFPWFLTKIVTGTYSGWFLVHFCPDKGPQDTRTLWLIYAAIAFVSPLALLVARRWLAQSMQSKHEKSESS